MKRNWGSLTATVLATFPACVLALGLGDIDVSSSLNEPLQARIPLQAVQPGDIEGMRVGLGTAEQFQRAGIERPFGLSALKFTVDEGGAGPGITVTTPDPVVEPFLNFLIEVNWPRGRVIREYTVLLDPPVYGSAIKSRVRESVATVPDVPAERTPAPVATAPAPEPTPAPSPAPAPTPAPAPAPAPSASSPPVAAAPEPTLAPSTSVAPSAPAPSAPAPSTAPARPTPTAAGTGQGSTYGPVNETDTLWSIADRYRPDVGVSVQKMMLAILEANPEAFYVPNVNALRKGAVLRIPTRDELGSDDRAAILAEIRRQYTAWDDYRQGLAAQTTTAPAQAVGAAEEPAEDTVAAPATGEEGESRVEVVAGGTSTETGAMPSEGAGDVAALRDELQLASEEAEAARLQTEDLASRLGEAEELISDLERLIQLKDDNIAALQEQLAAAEQAAGATTDTTTEPMAGAEPDPSTEPMTAEPTTAEPMTAEPMAGTETGEPSETMTAEPMAGTEAEPTTEPMTTEPMAGTEAEPSTEPTTTEPMAGTESEPETVASATTEPSAPEPAVAPTPEPAPTPAPAQPAPPASTLDMLRASLPVDPIMLGAGIGGLLVLGGGLALMRRRKAAAAAADAEEGAPPAIVEDASVIEAFGGVDEAVARDEDESGAFADTGDVPAQAESEDDATQVSDARPVLDQADAHTEEDPLAEVNVYLAYERYQQAEDLVRGAIEKYPDRHQYRTRLLEVLFAAGSVAAFQGAAREMRDFVGEDSPDLQNAAEMWAELAPGTELFGDDVAEGAEGGGELEVFDVTSEDASATLDDAGAVGEGSGLDFDLGFDASEAERTADAPEGSDSGLDFDLGFDAGDTHVQGGGEGTGTGEGSGLDFDLGDESADASSSSVDFDLSETGQVAPPAAADTGIDFDLSGEPGGEPSGAEAEPDRQSVPERIGEGSGLDFDLGTLDSSPDSGIDTVVAPGPGEGGGETGAGSELDFDLGEPQASEGSGGEVDFDLGDGAEPTAGTGLDLDFDLGETGKTDTGGGEPADAPAAAGTGLDLDFDLGEGTSVGADAPESTGAGTGMDIDFDLGDTGKTEDAQAASTGSESAITGLDLDFDLGDTGKTDAGDAPADGTGSGLDLDFDLTADDGSGTSDPAAIDSGTGVDFDLGETMAVGTGPAADGEASGADDVSALDFDIGGDDEGVEPAGGDELDLSLDDGTGLPGGEDLAIDLDLDLGEDSSSGLDIGTSDAAGLDFDLGDGDEPEGKTAVETVQLGADQPLDPGQPDLELEAGEPGSDDFIDTQFRGIFDEGAGQAPGTDEAPAAADDAAPSEAASGDGTGDQDTDFEATQFMLRDVPEAPTPAPDGDDDEGHTLMVGGEMSGEIDEIQTKLDLAQAYIDMDDADSARGVLGEVMAEGDAAQQEVAKGLLAKLS